MTMQQLSKGKPAIPAPLPGNLEIEARLTLDQVSVLTGLGRTKIYAEIKSGRLPEPERRGKRCSRWRAGSLIAALNGVTA
jgi:predicted DNA-binding transcriptional regulator AlpA